MGYGAAIGEFRILILSEYGIPFDGRDIIFRIRVSALPKRLNVISYFGKIDH